MCLCFNLALSSILFRLTFLVFSALSSNQNSYDYIVVGGGTAGGTLAAELSRKGFKTLLIEAGPAISNSNISVPGLHPRAAEDERTVFNYKVKHYENGKDIIYPRGSAIGGSSILNALISMYPNRRDFDEMVRLTGDYTWSEHEMRKYYNKITNILYPINKVYLDKPDSDKWMPISYFRFLRTLDSDLPLLATILYFLPFMSNDLNGYDNNGRLRVDIGGESFLPMNIDKNMKRGNFVGHIMNASKFYDLDIWSNTLATKIIFDHKIKSKAIGIQYIQQRYIYKANPLSKKNLSQEQLKHHVVYAKKEVILCAGAFNTPQLLMLSGIGDRSHLDEIGIKTLVDLPGVGINLQDRYEIPIVIQYPKHFSSLKKCRLTDNKHDECYHDYIKSGFGPYIGNGILSGELKKSDTDLQEPDLVILNFLGLFQGYKKGWASVYAKSFDKFTKLILKARTKNNKGTVKLFSSNPLDQPIINFNYFQKGGKEDLRVLINEFKRQRDILKRSPLEHIETKPGNQVSNDTQIKKYIMEESWGHHACCTAKIGTEEDKYAVINGDFQVYGTSNLRIVDASIFPNIPALFPSLFIHMISHKASEVIARDYELNGS